MSTRAFLGTIIAVGALVTLGGHMLTAWAGL